MKEWISQGDILKIERIKVPVLVVSKDYFNHTGEVIGCPIVHSGKPGALHILISTEKVTGYVQCEKMTLLDMNIRGYTRIDRIYMPEIIDITDAIQAIIDYEEDHNGSFCR